MCAGATGLTGVAARVRARGVGEIGFTHPTTKMDQQLAAEGGCFEHAEKR
jgi:hypothetical protein